MVGERDRRGRAARASALADALARRRVLEDVTQGRARVAGRAGREQPTPDRWACQHVKLAWWVMARGMARPGCAGRSPRRLRAGVGRGVGLQAASFADAQFAVLCGRSTVRASLSDEGTIAQLTRGPPREPTDMEACSCRRPPTSNWAASSEWNL